MMNFSESELRARKVDVAISLTATDADKEIAPAKAGMIPVLVEAMLSFSGAWTMGFEDENNTVLEGAHTFASGGTYAFSIGERSIKGTSGKALHMNANRTAGDLTGRVSYIYIPA